ncbi:MAG: hypothetical protein U9N40_01695 [Euryarchaeota archaeon]|nr:hypothetical protein [Euryarchaeota archaeon]
MFGRNNFVVLIALIIFSIAIAGCVSTSFGNVSYDGNALYIQVINDGEPEEIGIQVTIFNLSNYRQTEVGKYVSSVYAEKGVNEYPVTVDLEPGRYKLYLYTMTDGSRTGCEIRDINV